MRLLTITCAACGRTWAGARRDCVYERLAVESCPCPVCGAYTLGLHEPKPPRRPARRRPPDAPPAVENRKIAG
jgi:hypothetical protein